MSISVSELQPALQELFNAEADRLAKEAGLCRRSRKLTGSVLAKSVVFSLLERPDSGLEDFADFALDNLQVDAAPQSFSDRLAAAAPFFASLLSSALQRSFSCRPALLPVLRRFNGVYLRDGSLVALPGRLADLFPARKNKGGKRAAAVKLVFEMELTTGLFTEVEMLPALANEKTSQAASKPLPAGSLLLEDMGFLDGDRLQEYEAQGVYFLTRVPHWTAFFTAAPRGEGLVRLDLLKWLRRLKGWVAEREVSVFHKHRMKLRLLAVRVPEAVAEERRRRVRLEARRHGRAVSQRALDLCEWNVLVTNAPADLISAGEGWEVRRVRWQVELVFRLFKSEGGLERTQARKAGRALAEVWAKLLALVVQQWLVLAAGLVMLRHSLRRAARRARGQARAMLRALADPLALARELVALAVKIARRCRVQHRRQAPSTFDRLAARDAEFRDLDRVA